MKQILIILLVAISTAAFGQDKELNIKTSAVCEMCKVTLEKEMIFEKGVKKSNLDVESKILYVVYNPKKTDPETIRKRIALIGYDADSVKTTPEAIMKLDPCCRPGAHDDDH
ncbi:MAG: heavy-metal-associated domain-containing protein [Candidatus Cyclobacteriaceae bacterium M2_1C_046]